MTNKIKILSPHEAIKIAAGEVIERPAHIIKELIENSLDAQAKNITIQIENAGKTLIKITDDGCGMTQHDAKLCFIHHATSKITSVDDLQTINTFGFRGEALSSIASVSSMQVTTKTEPDKLATNIQLQHATIQNITHTSHPTGTTITIQDLFGNVPARKKFLKADETERNLIISIFQAFALQRIDVTFKIFDHNTLLFNCASTDSLPLRCAQLWDNHLHQNLIPIETAENSNAKIAGVISNASYQRFGRQQIFTFVNNRWVKNTEISKGIMKGYDGVLAYQKFPAAFIFIQAPTNEVDINVHPKKEEVKFLHPTLIQKLVADTIKQTLCAQTTKILSTPIKTIQPMPDPSFNTPKNYTQFFSEQHKIQTPISQAIEKKFIPAPIQQQNQTFLEPIDLSCIIGQSKKTYIILEKDDQIVFVDQHAAHERILFERFKKNIADTQSVSLLFAKILKLPTDDIILLMKFQNIFHTHGIVIDQFSDHEIIIQATPIQTTAQQAQEIIQTVLQWINQNQDAESQSIIEELHNKIISEKACKAACKAGDTLNQEQMSNIIEQLRATENNFCCPHGRPTLWSLTFDTIEKHFKRDYVGSKQILF